MDRSSNNKPDLSPLFLAVHLDSPSILKTLLDSSLFSVDTPDAHHRTPLMIAAGRGLDGCVKILLSYGPRLTAKDHLGGSTTLHACCSLSGQPSTLRLLLGAAGRGKGNTALQRLLCLRNGRSQTAMHVVCALGRTDLLEVLLSEGGSAASKATRSEDADGRTPLLCAVAAGAADCAMALLMWGGNRQSPVGANSSSQQKVASKPPSSAGPCPLALAASAGSADMVNMMLEFGKPSGAASVTSTFDHGAALVASLELDPLVHGADRLDTIRLLIEAGADPHAAVDNSQVKENVLSLGKEGEDDPPRTPIARAATMCCTDNADALRTILEAHMRALASKRAARRSDPPLRRQPDSYFDRIETAEDVVIAASMQDALVRTLFLGWRDSCQGIDESFAVKGAESAHKSHLVASLVLYHAGIRLSDSGLERLERSLSRRSLQGNRDSTASLVRCFEAVYTHFDVAGCQRTKEKMPYGAERSSLGGWSRALAQLDWMWHDTPFDGEIVCAWMRERLRTRSNAVKKKHTNDECYLVIEGHRLLVHKSIISSKSSKLAAAVRFASLNRASDDANEADKKDNPLEIHVDAPFLMMKMLLQHIYHGSIVSGLSWSKPSACCRQLFELAFLADEFVCPSLLVEVEMRLLSDRPDVCVCWCCCAAVHCVGEKQEGGKGVEIIGCAIKERLGLGSPVTCLYRVMGPSQLIQPETAIDILAVAEEAGELGYSDFTLIKHKTVEKDVSHLPMMERSILHDYEKNQFRLTRPFVAAKAVAVEVLLRDFSSAMKSNSYLLQAHSIMEEMDNTGSAAERGQHVAFFLLETCLEGMANAQLSFSIKGPGNPSTKSDRC
uniref:BTB domain-containing protein n=2 Tax=Odontella aurita TaxID=265563 RepID=A0A7S4I5W1_9STRA|mmetsp:Transcript_20383/g.58964  ORF Transcript_20383/g.58964 Transcript_20383/m.58964 type:complete len:840 (+) Transcript_20383:73-2592(+)